MNAPRHVRGIVLSTIHHLNRRDDNHVVKRMATVVLSVGGSLIVPDEPNITYLKKLTSLLTRMSARYRLAVVVGGGSFARKYARAVREVGGNEFFADSVSILSTRQNAMLLVTALGNAAYPHVIDDFSRIPETKKILVMGGTIPGMTTDGDTALLAEYLHADRIVNLSNVDGIYDADPRTNPNAKKFTTLTHAELLSLAMRSDERKAGQHFVFDIYACKIIARSIIETHFVNGNDLDAVASAIAGRLHTGTVVKTNTHER